MFPIYDIKLHHICSTSNLVQPPFNVISIVSMWWKLFMLRKIFQSSNFSLFSKEKGKVVWLTYLIIFNLVCIWILWIYQIFYTVLWLILMSSSIFVFLIFLIAIRQIFHKQMENPSPLCLLPISKGKTNKREIGIGSILKREGDWKLTILYNPTN